jgi:hypothetical protein
MDQEMEIGVHFTKWVSGDYSAATDGVDIRQTMAAHNASIRNSIDPFGDCAKLPAVLERVIGPHQISYPEKSGVKPVLQRNGQLMGSPLSFPYLCAINLAAYSAAMDKYLGYHVPLRRLPVKINGDDILFRANDAFYRIWQEEVAKVGFKLSLGKNFISENFLTANSLYFYWNRHRGILYDVPYLNAGLLTGQSKLSGGQSAKAAPIQDYYNKVQEGASDPVRAHRRFLHYHRENIAKLTENGQFNLFLPRERGGVGFELPVGVSNTITPFQQRWAQFMTEQGYDTDIEMIGLKGSPALSGTVAVSPKLTNELERGPLYGPLNENETAVSARLFFAPALSQSYNEQDSGKLQFRHPSARERLRFRAAQPGKAPIRECYLRPGPWIRRR